MEEKRVRICDIAEELGLSTATVSNVIHGKTKKISDETVRRVQQLLEERQYIPSMAGILLAQNNSRIIGVVVNDHEKYEGHVLEDVFIASSLNYLSAEIEKTGNFMMVKTATEVKEIMAFASMWNMDGLVIIGFCEQDYQNLRDAMRIPFVVYDGYFESPRRICNLTLDNYDGGLQIGHYFKELGHKKVLCVSDNAICLDLERYQGFRDGFGVAGVSFLQIPMQKELRRAFYEEQLTYIMQHTAVFAVSDYYAIELMQFLMERGVKVPEDISIAGFDDNPICELVVPSLTSIRQDGSRRAQMAIKMLNELRQGEEEGRTEKLPVTLVKRKSTAICTKQKC